MLETLIGRRRNRLTGRNRSAARKEHKKDLGNYRLSKKFFYKVLDGQQLRGDPGWKHIKGEILTLTKLLEFTKLQPFCHLYISRMKAVLQAVLKKGLTHRNN